MPLYKNARKISSLSRKRIDSSLDSVVVMGDILSRSFSNGHCRGREGSCPPSTRIDPGVRNYRTRLFRDTHIPQQPNPPKVLYSSLSCPRSEVVQLELLINFIKAFPVIILSLADC